MLNSFFFPLVALVSLLCGIIAESGKLGFSLPCTLLSREFTHLWAAFLSICSRRISHDLAHHSTAFIFLQCYLPNSYLLASYVESNILIPSQQLFYLGGEKKIHQVLLCIVKNTEQPGLSISSFSTNPLSHESLEILSIGEAGEWRILQGVGMKTSTDWTLVRMMNVHPVCALASQSTVLEWAETCINF